MNDATQFFNTSGGGYEIERSLRFNSSDSAYCGRSFSSAGNRKTWTWSAWVKRSDVASQQSVWSGGSSGTNRSNILFQGTNELRFFNYAGSVNVNLVTTPVFRDPSAWYHIVLAADTTQATAADRIKIYVNGTQITTFSTSTYPSQNLDLVINSAIGHSIGRAEQTSPAEHFTGYLADVHFIDGQALDPTSFTEVDATTGQLIPKQYTGSFGTNGFWLKFSDNSAATATTLGKDYSGNSNNWTPNNLSVTAGAGNDSLVDTPSATGTDTGAGGEVRGNYCTYNPLAVNSGSLGTISDGNLQVQRSSGTGTNGINAGTIGIQGGKWYWEVTVISASSTYALGTGIASSLKVSAGTFSTNVRLYESSGEKVGGGSLQTYGSSYTTGDVIGIAFDADNGSITFYKNNTSQGTAFTGISTGVAWFPATWKNNSSSSNTHVVNFGQRPFAYTAPSGFKALCTTNLPAPVVAKPSTVMDVALYTGNGSTQTISGLGFSPDLVWIKNRAATYGHIITDSVRGTTKQLYPYSTNAESTETTALTAFNSDGFSLGSWAPVNVASNAHVAWTWDAGSSTVTNTQGSITSQVRANASAGFSIVGWTANGSTATIGHGLGVAPAFIVSKNRTSGSTSWSVYHSSLGKDAYLSLNTTNASAALSNFWGSSTPDSTVFGVLGGRDDSLSSNNIIAYCFAPVAGYSSFGSYTGNGSADGPFVYTGFRPRWVMIKGSSYASNWNVIDAARDPYNLQSNVLRPNSPSTEFSDPSGTYAICWDALSNGFKLRGGSGTNDVNQTSATYIYAAFAENPFKYARAR